MRTCGSGGYPPATRETIPWMGEVAVRPGDSGPRVYFEAASCSPMAAWAAARRAIGTRKGEQDT